jgi:hypothetical protein
MKKLMSAVVAAIAVAASAATWERAGSLQVADTTGLAAAVAKLGEISGNQMLGAMAAAQLSQLPTSEFFGPTRQGGSIAMPLYFDMDAFAKAGSGDEEAFDDLDDGAVEYAVVYPMALPKEEFVKLHEGAVETNGMVRVQGLPFGDADEDDFTYVVFADGGKWAVASDRPEQVALALKDLPELVKPMGGDVVRLSATPKGFEALRKVLDVAARKCAEEDEKLDVAAALDLVKGLDAMRLALRVGDAGVDFPCGFSAVPGSTLSKMGATAFSAESLSEAGPDAISFSKSSFCKANVEESWKLVAEVLAKHKIDTSSFLKWQFGKMSRLTVDMPALVGWAKAAETNGLDEVDCDELSNDLAAAFSGKCQYIPAEAPEGCAVAFAGYKPKFSACDRFLATLPEAKGRKLLGASVFSLSGLVQAILPAVLASLDAETRAMVAPMAALLPKEAKCGIVSAYWRKDDGSVAGLTRISADEIKGIGASAGAIMAATMMNVGAGASDDDDDDGSSDED